VAKEELEKLRILCGSLMARIEREKAEPEKSFVELIDAAQTPLRPTRPNRIIGAAMLILGGVSLLTGFLLLLMTVRLEKPLEA
jgi:hypothetical protein